MRHLLHYFRPPVRQEREIMGRVYAALARLDTEPETTRELIEGVHALRFQLRGAYQALYKRTPERDGHGD